MGIDKLILKNYKCFEDVEISFDPHFNLLIGPNAAGKTAILDALNVAIGGWFLGVRGYTHAISIDDGEVRRTAVRRSDAGFNFEQHFPCQVETHGNLHGQPLIWSRELNYKGGRTTRKRAASIQRVAQSAKDDRKAVLPLLCSFGAERLWYETAHRELKNGQDQRIKRKFPSRLDGYTDCLHFELQDSASLKTVRNEQSRSEQTGLSSLTLACMKHAARNLLDGVKDFYFDWGLQDIVIVFGENEPCLFQNLSAGQRAILGLAFDLARRAATLNDFLGEDILSQTPGVVTIDELDMHLHPAWQRSIIHSLRKTFPKVQFIASTHSPQIIGEAQPHQVLIVEHAGVSRTERSFGMDSNRVLREIMGTIEMDSTTKEQLDNLALLIDDENFYEARQLIRKLSSQIGEDSPDLVHAHSLIELLEPTQ